MARKAKDTPSYSFRITALAIEISNLLDHMSLLRGLSGLDGENKEKLIAALGGNPSDKDIELAIEGIQARIDSMKSTIGNLVFESMRYGELTIKLGALPEHIYPAYRKKSDE